jgi:competence protein ComEA
MLERFKYPIFAVILIAIVSGIVVLLSYRPAPTVITIIPPGPTVTPHPLRVYVTGNVKNGPQTYDLPVGSRIEDAIKAAGGTNPDADLSSINLAQALYDGQKIDVPTKGVQLTGDSPAPDTAAIKTAPTATPDGPLHINVASLEELQRLPGVGPALAQKIIDYRTEHGPFQSMADLDNVSGIGESRLQEWEGKIAFD